MKVTPHQTEKLLNGNYAFKQLGFSMMITRLKMLYSKNPTKDMLDKAMNDINEFLVKFAGIMESDYKLIPK